MSKRVARVVAAVVPVLLGLAWWAAANGGAADAPKAAGRTREPFFGLTRVHEIHLSLTAEQWAKLQPAAPRSPWAAGGGAAPAAGKSGDVHKGGFGMEFPWSRGELTVDGETLHDVGLRYKGNYTYIASARGLKRPIKLDLVRHVRGQRLAGLKKLNLHNGLSDLTRTREVLAYAVFRAAGVPAPRTAYAELTLSVPGKYDREYVGLYTVTEDVDRTFLKDRFGDGDGLLLKPEGLQNGLPHLGDDWKQYETRYRPRGEPDARQRKRLIEFTRLVNEPDDARFRREIGTYLNVDEFLRFLAVNALLANLDSFLGFGHNFYLYLRPDTNRFVFIPWDTDMSFGAWPVGGTPEQQAGLSIRHPHRGANRLIDRLLADKETEGRYREILKELTASCFTRERLLKDLGALEETVAGPLAREEKAVKARREGTGGLGFGPGGGGGAFGQSLPPRKFIPRRTESVAAQLAGKAEGFVPPAGFGFGPAPQPPRPGEVMPRTLRDQLRLTPEQRRRFDELQKEVDRKVQEILTEEQKAQLRRQPGGRPPGPPRFGRP